MGIERGFGLMVAALVATLVWTDATASGELVNPLNVRAEGLGPVTSCADPTIIHWEPPGDGAWYMICTSDPLSGADRDAEGDLRYRLLPTFRSENLLDWEYVGDALPGPPSWAEPWSQLWAPELVQREDGSYSLYFTVTDTRASVSGEPGCGSDSAIGVATSSSPAGPWDIHDEPVVPPRRSGGGCAFLSTIDPEVIHDETGQDYLLLGGYKGGIVSRRLGPGGLSASPATEIQLATARYEAPEVFRRDGDYYLFVSPNGCCNGDLTGYSVMVGRAGHPEGPYLDRSGQPLTAGRTGGTPALAANGGAFVGPGHVSVFGDRDGTTWMLYHAIERSNPFFEGEAGFTRRPVFVDPVVWDEAGWPAVRGGWGTGECPQSAPAARDGETSAAPDTRRRDDVLGEALLAYSDDFEDGLGSGWSWVREPPDGTWSVEGGVLRIDTQTTELYHDDDNAGVLLREAPPGDFAVEAELRLDLPAEGCCWDFAQAGLLIYGDDDRYLKLVHVSIGATRQTEFAKEVPAREPGWPRFGGSGVGPPGDSTVLRIVRRVYGEQERYTAYTRALKDAWVRGGTWTHRLGDSARIGLVAMNRAGFEARFERVTTYALLPYPCEDPALADPCRASPPDEVEQLDVEPLADTGDGSDSARLSWTPTLGADVYDVSRSALSSLGEADYGPCLADDRAGTEMEDAQDPPAGDGFGYLVRGAQPLCAWAGPWGAGRQNDHPSACP